MNPLRPAPALARRLLCALLPSSLRDDVAANMDDLHARRARARGQRAADVWYWQQALSLPLRLRLAGDVPAGPAFTTRTSIMRAILQDLQYAWRLHRARPALAIVAGLSLAVGIGLNTAIFSVVNGVLLRPAPIDDVERLVMIWQTDRNTGTTREPASLPDFLDFRDRSRAFASMGALIAREANVAPPGGDPARLAELRVSHELLPMLGIRPRVGRLLAEADAQPGAERVMLISESLWSRMFDRDPAVIGRRLALDDVPATVVGVVDDATDFGVLQILGQAAYSRSFADRGRAVRVDAWTPLAPDPVALPRSTHPLFVVGRLAPGASLDAAREELTTIAADLEAAYPNDNNGRGAHLEPLADVVFGPTRPALVALVGAVALVLLVACANVANLLLARGASRQREVAVRLAVGAGRGRLVRQFLTESVALSVAAGLAGILIAFGALSWIVAAGPADVPRLASASIDLTVLAVTLAVSLACGVIFGIVPALQARATAPRAALGERSRGGSGGREGARWRGALVVAELALAVVLVAGAGLLLRSFWQLTRVDAGFETAGVVKAEFQLPGTRYPVDFSVWPDFKEIHAFNAALESAAAALPGVEQVAIAGNHPLDPGFTNSFLIVGRESEAGSQPEISVRRTTPGYFATVGLDVVSGRAFDATDTTQAPAVALVNQTAAARFFPGSDPIGQAIRLWGADRRIIGTVADERFQGLDAGNPIAVYLPLSQTPSTNGRGVLLVRTTGGDLASMGPTLQRTIQTIDPALGVFGVEPLTTTVSQSVAEERFTLVLLGLFAVMALGLAAVGIHGVLTCDVAERRRELGIRLALGARPERLRRRVVLDGLALASVGLVIGMIGAVLLTRALRSLLFSVSPTDPLTFGAAGVVLVAVAAAASYVPARRVTTIDPNEALRADA